MNGNDNKPAAQEAVARPEPYIIGNQYRTQAGDLVRFVAVHNEGTSYECMEDESGVNRYTRRDFGRVTGTCHEYSDPRNTPPLYAAPVAAAPALDAELAQDRMSELCELERDVLDSLPAVYYMDPPDGGNVSLGEQVKRMAEDAALWRKHSSTSAAPGIDPSKIRELAEAITTSLSEIHFGHGSSAMRLAKQIVAMTYARKVREAATTTPVDLTNWAAHYGINPAAVEALQSMLASTPAAPGVDLEQFRPAVQAYRFRQQEFGSIAGMAEADRLLALIDASPKGGSDAVCVKPNCQPPSWMFPEDEAAPAASVTDWRIKAAAWLEEQAVEQENTNKAYPAHVAAYPSWADRVHWLRTLASKVSESQATSAEVGAYLNADSAVKRATKQAAPKELWGRKLTRSERQCWAQGFNAATIAAEPTIPEPHQECYSDNDGDSWYDHPADSCLVDGLAVGDTYTLSVSHYSVGRTYRVTKAPDETSDDYEVEPVQATSAEVGA